MFKLDNVSQAINRFPNLDSFGFSLAKFDAENVLEAQATAACADEFANALIRHAPRVQYFSMKDTYFRLKDHAQRISWSDPDMVFMLENLNAFVV